MPSYPSINDREFDLLKKITENTANINGGGGGSGITALTGDVTASGSGSVAATLADTAVTPASYTSADITVDSKGRITSAANGSGSSSANPTATVSGSVVNGSASTFMRSDAAPALAATAVTPGSYTNTNLTVDQQGRITAAASGSSSGGVASVTGTSPIASSGGSTPAISLNDTAVTPASYTYASITVDQKGRLTAASSGTAPASAANPTASVGPSAVNGSAATFMRSDAAPTLANTAVTPGAYTNLNATIDAQGRITAAASGSPGGVTSVTGTSPIASSGGATPAISLNDTAVTPASYTYASITVDQKGRLTAASSGSAPASAANPTSTISGSAVNGSASTYMRSDAAPALANTAVTAASYTNANLTVDAQGRITAASNGSGTIGGSTGSTDNSILRADGTGGSTLQATGSLLTGDDTGGLTQIVTSVAANTISTGHDFFNNGTASSGNQMYSPSIFLRGIGWKTTATAAGQEVDWRITNVPVQGTSNPSTQLLFASQVNGLGYVTRSTLTSAGNLSISAGITSGTTIDAGTALSAGSSITAGTSITAGGASGIIWSARSQLQSSSNGLVELLNNGGSAFTRLNFGGTTSSFVSLQSSGTTLTVGTADGGTSAGSLVASASITSTNPTSGIGYSAGAGGTVTQITNRSTGVTINKICGTITTDTTSLAALTSATFTVTDSAVAIGDVPMLAIRSGQTNKETTACVTRVAAGAFDITIGNENTLTDETGAIIINFAVIKAVTS